MSRDPENTNDRQLSAARQRELAIESFPPVPQGIYGVCEGCGAVAWELLDGRSTMCLGCDPAAYRQDEWDDDEADEFESQSQIVARHGDAYDG